jgi:hypothetical protein
LTAQIPLSTSHALSFPHVSGVHASGDTKAQEKTINAELSTEPTPVPPQVSSAGQSLAVRQPHCPSSRQLGPSDGPVAFLRQSASVSQPMHRPLVASQTGVLGEMLLQPGNRGSVQLNRQVFPP